MRHIQIDINDFSDSALNAPLEEICRLAIAQTDDRRVAIYFYLVAWHERVRRLLRRKALAA